MQPDGTYRSAREGAVLNVHPSSVMFTRQPSTGWVIFHEVVETTKSFMRDLTVVDEEWLVELAYVGISSFFGIHLCSGHITTRSREVD